MIRRLGQLISEQHRQPKRKNINWLSKRKEMKKKRDLE
jgi:hypothetical protein